MKRRASHLAAAIALLIAAARLPDSFCRVECAGAAASRSAAVETCHTSGRSRSTDSERSPAGKCPLHARHCVLDRSNGVTLLTEGSASRTGPVALAAVIRDFRRLDPVFRAVSIRSPFASPPTGVRSSVLRL